MITVAALMEISRLGNIHECNLEVPVWSTASDSKRPELYRPRLVFLRTEWGNPELLAQVSAWADDLRSRDRWILQFYPTDARDLLRQEDEKRDSFRRWPRRLDPQLSEGELRHPRDTAAAAIKLAVELLADIIPKADLVAVEKVAGILRPQFELTTRAYLTRFRAALGT